MKKDVVIAVIAFALLMFLMGRCVYQRMDSATVPHSNNSVTSQPSIKGEKELSGSSEAAKRRSDVNVRIMPTQALPIQSTPTQAVTVPDTRPFVDVN